MDETPSVQATRSTIGQVEPIQRKGSCQRAALTWVRLQTRSVWLISESQNLKRESKSLILPLELTQRADFAPQAYTA